MFYFLGMWRLSSYLRSYEMQERKKEHLTKTECSTEVRKLSNQVASPLEEPPSSHPSMIAPPISTSGNLP